MGGGWGGDGGGKDRETNNDDTFPVALVNAIRDRGPAWPWPPVSQSSARTPITELSRAGMIDINT